MNKRNKGILVLIISSTALILDIALHSNGMNLGFWLRIIMNVFLVISAIELIKKQKKPAF